MSIPAYFIPYNTLSQKSATYYDFVGKGGDNGINSLKCSQHAFIIP